ncbi:MAG: tripartite tricarboxylate transporter permease [Deltaproteobacteria bacterium]|nr:tripartite tricarboxylate transporter permease [Deltaproteobacteria bacterium]MBI2227510.1 tripartite tricarboxylate transporter permease [Deltaproteobacteria bacterium]MBI2368177.1 tripartite tricarboxylate transporter permease [Deltaproteobacteria bacterium]MBI2534675.1 tripartite tricarboxylate transporter permease [Deltaproteobacteria bacterium]MBI3066858.1 tripartite tricarboxylate transporter permease [Deltaproteobacteria bacterium]
MFDALIDGLWLVLQWKAFSLMMVGMLLGFAVGLLPGIGGAATLALMLPFIFKMAPAEAFAFLLGMHAVAATTGDITSILFGVPGEAISAATVVDGYPMTKRGEAGRALGAALTSSLLGALIGAGALALAIPVVRPLVLTFGSPELFMLAIIGISCITSLSGAGARGQIKGFAMGLLGLLLSTIGQERQSGSLRFDMGMMYLWDGLDFVPVLVGIFAIPEIVDLAIRGTAIAGERQPENLKAGVMEGVKDTFRHYWLVFRCSVIGVFVGILPGAGGGVAQWMAYAHAVQSAKNTKDREGFGKGDIRGVLGPGAANNSKEGGELIPTIAFGVPGSGAMAILLGGFLIMGIIPGPDMLTKHLAITFSMVWTLVIANIITVVLCLLVLDQLAKITYVRGGLIIPFVLLLVFVGSYTANGQIADLIVTFIFGLLSYFMVLYGWPRPPFVLGFVLGKVIETYLFISVSRYGFTWLRHPVVITLIVLMVIIIAYPYIQQRRDRLRSPANA